MPDSPKNTARPLIPAGGRRPGTGSSRGATGRRPLPDAQAIRTCLVPLAAPPYDDAAAENAVAPVAEPERRAAARRIAANPRHPDREVPAGSGPWPSQFAQVLAETLAGSRPARQIRPWTTEQARKRISELGPMLGAGRQPRVRRVIVRSPAQGVLEMTVVVDFGARARAVAVRLEQPSQLPPTTVVAGQPDINAYRGQRPSPTDWVCTAIEAA
jgi:Family of unknown function (DUF6459)